jgi:Domain of unknown function (DUF4412)
MRLLRTFPLAALLLGLCLPSLSGAQDFEGVITTRQITLSEAALSELLDPDDYEEETIDYRKVFAIPMDRILMLAGEATDEVTVQELTYSIKGTKLRVSGNLSETMPGYAILDFAAGTFQLVQPSQKMYLELTKADFEKFQAMMPETEKEGEVRESVEARPLGLTKEINGMQCDAFEIKTEKWVSVACVTPELEDLVGAFVEFESRMDDMGMFDDDDEDSEIFSIVAEHGFPVLEQTFYTFGGYGAEYEIMEITKVERKSLPAEYFGIPSDYERLGIMDMMEMFGRDENY